MKIPRSFSLLGTTYHVLIISAKEWEAGEDDVGYFIPQKSTIAIKAGERQLMEQTFCHEQIHAILNAMGENRLYTNEKFVDTFAGLLHQALNSSAYK